MARNKNTELDNFMNPVGSVDMKLHSRYGNLRHYGSFSEDNPFLTQINEANYNSKKQDIDALYERAVEWEADRANLLEQRRFDYAVLQEQREYDLPENQIQRMREAGINPDISGGSSAGGSIGGSSAHMNSSQIADQTGQTKFANSYDDTQMVFEGLNTAANFISTISSLGGTVVDSICKINMLDPQRRLVNAQVGLVDAQSREVNTLLDGKKTSQDISNINSRLSNLAQVASLTSAESSDEDILSFLRGVGIGGDEISDSMNIVRQMHSNPAMLSKYYTDSNELIKQRARYNVYTEQATQELTEIAYRTQKQKQLGDFHAQNIATSLQTALDNPEYKRLLSQNAQNAEVLSGEQISTNREQLKLVKAQLKHNLEAFFRSLGERQASIESIKRRRAALLEKYDSNKDGMADNVGQQSVLDGMTAEIIALETMNSQQFHQIHSHFTSAAMKFAGGVQYFDSEGRVQSDDFRKSWGEFFNLSLKEVIGSAPTQTETQMYYDKMRQENEHHYSNLATKFVDAVIPL